MRGRLLLLLLAVGELLLCPVVEPVDAPRHLQVERHGHHGVEAWHPKDYTIVPSGASSKKEAHRAKGKEDLLAEIVARRAKVKHEHELGPSTSASPPPPPPPTVPPPHSRSSNSTTANIGAKRRPPVGVFIHCSCTTRWKETLDELVLGVLGGGLMHRATHVEILVASDTDQGALVELTQRVDGYARTAAVEYPSSRADIRVVVMHHPAATHEMPALLAMWHWAGEHMDHALLYLHTKGAGKPYNLAIEEQRQFATHMLARCSYEACLERMFGDDRAVVCGVDRVQTEGRNFHYAGNFWWTRADHIRGLPSPSELMGASAHSLHPGFFRTARAPFASYYATWKVPLERSATLCQSGIDASDHHLKRYPASLYTTSNDFATCGTIPPTTKGQCQRRGGGLLRYASPEEAEAVREWEQKAAAAAAAAASKNKKRPKAWRKNRGQLPEATMDCFSGGRTTGHPNASRTIVRDMKWEPLPLPANNRELTVINRNGRQEAGGTDRRGGGRGGGGGGGGGGSGGGGWTPLFRGVVDVLQVVKNVDCVVVENIRRTRDIYNASGLLGRHVVVTPDSKGCAALIDTHRFEHVKCLAEASMFGSRVTLSLVEEVMANLAPLALAQSRIGRVAPSAIKHMNRGAWYWQQFLKLQAVAAGAGGLREHVRIMDGDSISVRPMDWFDGEGRPILATPDMDLVWQCEGGAVHDQKRARERVASQGVKCDPKKKSGGASNYVCSSPTKRSLCMARLAASYGHMYQAVTGSRLYGDAHAVTHGMSMTRHHAESLVQRLANGSGDGTGASDAGADAEPDADDGADSNAEGDANALTNTNPQGATMSWRGQDSWESGRWIPRMVMALCPTLSELGFSEYWSYVSHVVEHHVGSVVLDYGQPLWLRYNAKHQCASDGLGFGQAHGASLEEMITGNPHARVVILENHASRSNVVSLGPPPKAKPPA